MKRLASFILALLFIGSNLGLAMGTHFCGGHSMGAEVILGHEDLSCGMMPEATAHHSDHPQNQNIHAIPCCANEFQSLSIEDEFQSTTTKSIVEQVVAITPLVETLDFSSQFVFTTSSPSDYSPPIRTGDVTILLQVFRI